MRTRLISLIILFSVSQDSMAGMFEAVLTGGYRKRNVSENNYETKESLTSSLAYYFWELSALQVSYTVAYERQVQPIYIAHQYYKVYGASLLITMATRESPVKPYLKVGGAYIIKTTRVDIPTFNAITDNQEGMAPTAGAGITLMLTKQFGIKGGVDVMSSPLNQTPVTYDFEANTGISLMF